MKNILVTGGYGQLASCLKDVSKDLKNYNFIYIDSDELDITNYEQVNNYFESNSIAYCINCAAYTAVDKAETDKEVAIRVNSLGVKNLVEACKISSTTLIQISTDFVFDGKQSIMYAEDTQAKPLSVYGTTKLDGEIEAAKLEKHYIIRTSWLYSEYGNNFLKTMLRLGAERDTLNVVSDQIGTPTYAGDLAKVIIGIINNPDHQYGTYHYSNEGVASWYDFAKAIFDISRTNVLLLPIKTDAYPTPAVRPAFSIMDKSKIRDVMKIEIPHWRDSLTRCLNIIHSIN